MNKTLFRFGLGILFFLLFFYITATRLDPDLGWHLRAGQDILRTRDVPRFDAYSHTMPGFPWVDHEWLADAGLAYLEQNGLWIIAVLIFTLLAFLPFAVWLTRLNSAADFFFWILAGLLTLNHIGVRPQVITLLLFFVLLEILNASFGLVSSGTRSRWSRWLLPLLFLLWVNLHGGFFLGLGVFGLYLAAAQFDRRCRTPKVWDWLIWLSSVALTFVNPYRERIYEEVYAVASSSDTAQYIAEWQSALVHPALKESLPLSVLLFIALLFFLASFIGLAWQYRRSYSLPILAVSIVLLLAYLKSLRFGPLFFVGAMPIYAIGLPLLFDEVRKLRQGLPFSTSELKFFTSIRVFAGVILTSFAILLLVSPGGHKKYSAGAVNFLKTAMPARELGNLFNDYGYGGYLIWHLPEVKVFIDGRMPHWNNAIGYSAMAEYVRVFYPQEGEPSAWREVFVKHEIRTVLIPKPSCKSSKFSTTRQIAPYLSEIGQIPCQIVASLKQEGWQVIYQDENSVIIHKL